MTTLAEIRARHASARPNVIENPAWAHTHQDCAALLALLDECRAVLRVLDNEISGVDRYHWGLDGSKDYGPHDLHGLVARLKETP